jgi:hypothetical protein
MAKVILGVQNSKVDLSWLHPMRKTCPSLRSTKLVGDQAVEEVCPYCDVDPLAISTLRRVGQQLRPPAE